MATALFLAFAADVELNDILVANGIRYFHQAPLHL